MNESAIRRLYSLLGHEGYYSRVGSLDCSSKQYEDKYVYGVAEVLSYARKWNGIRNVFIGRNPRSQSGDVVGSNCISFDIDSIREPGEAANDIQHNQAIEAGRRILTEYPGGSLCSSGNGCLLLYRADIRKDDLEDYYKKEKEFIRTLQTKVDILGGLNVKIDHTSYSEAVIKLVGTMSTKGNAKYHRLSRFITSKPSNITGKIILDNILLIQFPNSTQSAEKFKGNPIERLKKAQECLQKLGKEYYDDYTRWSSVGMSLREFGVSGLQLWKDWSKKSEKYEEGICEAKWPTFDEVPSLTLATLIKWSEEPRSIPINVVRDGYFEGLFQRDSRSIQPILTGISGIDTALQSTPRGEITTFAARSGFGKSSLACTIAEYNRKQGKKVLIFSTEMDYTHFMHKMVALSCNISLEKILNKQFSQEEQTRIHEYEQEFKSNPMIICDEFSPTLDFVKNQVEEVKPDLVVFDHISHVATHWEGIAQFMRGFKDLINQRGIPAFVLSMLNEPPRGSNGTIGASVRGDVRGSQEIIFLSAIYALINNPFEVKSDIQPVEIEITKNRYGLSNVKVECHVNKRTGRFMD